MSNVLVGTQFIHTLTLTSHIITSTRNRKVHEGDPGHGKIDDTNSIKFI